MRGGDRGRAITDGPFKVTTRATDRIGHLLRELAPQVLAAVTRKHGDFADAEDAVQEVLFAAATQWPDGGVPGNPRGSLCHVAMRRLTDQTRRAIARRERESIAMRENPDSTAATMTISDDIAPDGDDTLLLLFMCCHPSLTPSNAIALTLRAVGGLTTREIASAYLVPEATMAQRISRAKQIIKASAVPFTFPDEAERASRLQSVLHVLYLVFNEGYASTESAEFVRTDLYERSSSPDADARGHPIGERGDWRTSGTDVVDRCASGVAHGRRR